MVLSVEYTGIRSRIEWYSVLLLML